MRRSTLPVIAALLGGMLLIGPPPSWSQTTPKASVAELQREIDQLQRKLKALQSLDEQVQSLDKKVQAQQKQQQAQQQQQQAIAQQQQAQAQQEQRRFAELPTVAVDAKGLTVKSTDGDFRLNVHGLVQADGQFYSNGDDKTAPGGVTSSSFLLNRVRPIFDGTVFKNYDYHIEPDFGLGATVLQDAWLDAHPFGDAARVEAGKFKSPFGIERLQQDTNLLFIQRGLTTNLIPNRDLGTMLHGDLLDHQLTYQLAILNGVTNNTASVDSDSNDAKDFVGRFFALPFKDSGIVPLQGLGAGFAGSYGDERGALTKYKSSGQETFFTYASTVSAAGPRYRFSPQGYYYVGPFGLLADYVDDTQRSVDHIAESYTTGKGKKKKTHKYTAADYETFANHAWQIQAGFMLTGESESYYGVKPARAFNPSEGGWGAWEIKARFGSLNVDKDIFTDKFASSTTSAESATEYGGGLNWYLSQNVKLDFEYLWTTFYKGATDRNRPGEGAFLTQAQLAF